MSFGKASQIIGLISTMLVALSISYTSFAKTNDDFKKPEIKTVTGVATAMAAIGGETTGYALRVGDNFVEIELALYNLESTFVDGDIMTVSGYELKVTGLEIPRRQVLVVFEVLETQTYTGEFDGVVAIGGETTGTGLVLDDGRIIEVDLETNNLVTEFEPGKTATVTAYKVMRHGVERSYVAWVVVDIQN